MAVAHALGSFVVPSGDATNISPSLTWSDAGSHTPQAILFSCRAGAVASTNTGTLAASVGMTDGTTSFSLGVLDADNQTASTVAANRNTDDGCVVEVAVGGGEEGLLAFSSFGTDTFTLTVPNTFNTAAVVHYIAFAGYTNAKVHVTQAHTTTGNFSKTGIGFQPTCGIFAGTGRAVIDNGGTAGRFGFGWATGASNQACLSQTIRTAQTTDYTWGMVSTDSCMMQCANSATTPTQEVRFVSWDADGYTLNQVVYGGAQVYYGVLLLKGGAQLATTTTARTSTGTFNVTATGVDPDCVLGMARAGATANETSAVEDANHWWGAHTSSAQWAMAIQSANRETVAGGSPTETYSRSVADKFMIHYDRTAADTFAAIGEITKSSFASEQVTLDQTDADTALALIPLLILGDAVAGGGGSAGSLVGRRSLLRGRV